MKRKLFILSAALLCTLGFVACGGNQGDTTSNNDNPIDVVGTYSILYSKSEISGNIRHTGYVTSRENAYELNTVKLDADGTYEYTKLLSDDVSLQEGVASAKARRLNAAQAKSTVLFSWTSVESDGSTLVFNADGTFACVAKAGSYEVPSKGTWEWKNWSLKVNTEAGAEATGTMDGTTHALSIAIDCGHSVIRNFTVESSVWGAAFGGTGTYTPVVSDMVTYYYQGSGSKQGGGVSYDATIQAFLLKDGRAYVVEATSTNASKKQGSWAEKDGVITLTIENINYTSTAEGFVILDINTTLNSEIPTEYQTADWDELFEALNVTYSEHIKIVYTFKGTYTVTEEGVTLKTPTYVSWSEDWGLFQKHGFTNTSGEGVDAKVYPKGETGTFCYAIDHFNTNDFVMAPSDPTEITGDREVNIILDKENNTYRYNNKSIFD